MQVCHPAFCKILEKRRREDRRLCLSDDDNVGDEAAPVPGKHCTTTQCGGNNPRTDRTCSRSARRSGGEAHRAGMGPHTTGMAADHQRAYRSGVALDKGAQWLHAAPPIAGTALVRSGHLDGVSLTAASTVLLLFVCTQYWRDVRELAAIKGSRPGRLAPALIACASFIFLGAAVFFVSLVDTR